MSLNWKALARQKHRETGHSEADWFAALESARQSLPASKVNDRSLELFALSSRSPGPFTLLIRLVYHHRKSHPRGSEIVGNLLDLVNASPFTLAEWVDAIGVFHEWLTKHSRKKDFHSMLQYLECCVASPESRDGGQTLAELLADMLRIHGYDE